MSVQKQFEKIKDNWLIVVLILAVFLLSGVSNIISPVLRSTSYSSMQSFGDSYEMAKSSDSYYPNYINDRDFAPDETDRKITKTTTMASEIKRGTFSEEETKLKAILTSSNSFLLNENVNKYGEGWNEYRTGYYTIKVEATKFDSVITQLKAIGEITSFNEVKKDITGLYENAEIEMAAEKSRLQRYQEMYKEASLVADKTTLNDRIFDQERTIKYMEERIDNMDRTIEYSTVYYTLNEKRSDFAGIVLVKISDLIRNLVGSFNAMISLVFVLLPWAAAWFVIRLIVRLAKRK